MKKMPVLAIGLLVVFSTVAGPLVRKGGHDVQLSTGENVKVAFYDETNVDPATRKSAGSRTVVVFQSSAGTRIGMTTTATRGGKAETTIWSADGHDQISMETDLSFKRQGLATPMTVTINGRSAKLLVEPDLSGEADKRVRKKLAPELAKLSPDFVSAVKELFRLGHAGYPNMGTGWTDLLTVLDPAEVAIPGAKIVAQSAMSEADQKSIGDALQH